ncbi:MAG: SPP-like hydrolase [Candidatus Aramenus sulfurataquae]|uniref:Phosphoglycolate phosphatase n=1 Tax=Candidatus Aramenus sulfurataquae TaxID=1326980 RepID=W7KJJ3_9CREN|nr:MAG: SPP-like hydrolase [Candidatus Aramenus sulfurataquae]
MSEVLVASDYDRTLSEEKDNFFISERVKKRINDFSRRHFFVVVTGRERRFIERLAYGLCPTAWVLENGALLLLNGKVIYNVPRGWSTTRYEVGKRLERNGIEFTYGEVIVYVNNSPKAVEKILSDIEVKVEWNRNDAMVLPRGVNKGTGILKLAKIMGFKGKIVGVGDSQNDISLFEVADFKVAVNNALEEIKRIADLVLSKPDGEGVIELLDMIEEGRLFL